MLNYRIKKILLKFPVIQSFIRMIIYIYKKRNFLTNIIFDLVETYNQSHFLRKIKHNKNGKILNVFVMDDDSIYGIKLFAYFSKALHLKGWKVNIIFKNKTCFLGKIYFKSFNLDNFIFLSDYTLTDNEKKYCKQNVHNIIQKKLSINFVKKIIFENCNVGLQTLSTISRIEYQGKINLNEKSTKTNLFNVLLNSFENIIKIKKLLNDNKANLALTIEANYAIFGPLVDLSILNNCDVIQMCQPWRDDAIVFKRLTKSNRRDHPSSIEKKNLQKLSKLNWTQRHENYLDKIFQNRYNGKWVLQNRNQFGNKWYTLSNLIKEFNFNKNKPLVVIFSHVMWDANLFYGKDIFKDTGDWFAQTILEAKKNKNVNWLIKIHPANIWKRKLENVDVEYDEVKIIKDTIGKLPNHIKVMMPNHEISSFNLFKLTDYGVTIRGTSGLELSTLGKPCITAGTGRYSNLGFTYDSDNKINYLDKIKNIHLLKPMSNKEIQLAKWHAYAVFELRLFKIYGISFDYIKKSGIYNPEFQNLKFIAKNLNEFRNNQDLIKWTDWLETNEIDYFDDMSLFF